MRKQIFRKQRLVVYIADNIVCMACSDFGWGYHFMLEHESNPEEIISDIEICDPCLKKIQTKATKAYLRLIEEIEEEKRTKRGNV